MFEAHIYLRNKFLRADDSGIRKVACAISESIVSAEFKLPLALLFKKKDGTGNLLCCEVR